MSVYNRDGSAYGKRDVVNPARIAGADDWEWTDWMREAIKWLVSCQSIVMLPRWVDSRGAMLEHHIARSLDMRVYEWIDGRLESDDLGC